MSISASPHSLAARIVSPSRRALELLFGSTILASACLLFLVQPLISKLILPWFGGSAAVWITCMLFFQSGLLLGYLYAHALITRLPAQRQSLIHGLILGLSLLALPILPNAGWQPAPGQDPTWNLFAVLATCVGLPYLLLSSTTPLLQSWYVRGSESALPYRYFALSNAGSLLALLAYPVVIEPHLTGHQQAWLWSAAFAVFVLLCACAAFCAARSHDALPHHLAASSASGKQPIALWLNLSACASTLLLAVTNLLTQNIAPMPLLWVIPLGVYLLTFILCFESDRWYRRSIFLPLVFPSIAALVAASGATLENATVSTMVSLLSIALFVCCMTCHGELARLRPAAWHLTTFYLCLSAGGASGGIFVALFAPHIFPAMFEYPIAFVALPALLLTLFRLQRPQWKRPQLMKPLWAGALACTVILGGYVCHQTWKRLHSATFVARNFYGALRVDQVGDPRNPVRELLNGTITHGVQFLQPAFRHWPTSYYARNSGIGLTWYALAPSGPLKMGVVGLGAGTLAAYGRGDDTLRFYDINPLVVKIAREQFLYLSDCPSHIDIVLGDARLSMENEPAQKFDILVIDAFSGDAIPVHLLTREAFQIYWRHLKPDGVLAVHVSNRYLNLAPIVALANQNSGKQIWQAENGNDDPKEIFDSTYVLVSSRPNFFNNPLFRGLLTSIDIPRQLRLWTDDYSNLWQVLSFKSPS
ncbi:MAG: fused MFS/spermidine synthase [Acidobacteriaceae bacterium]|nr:fused MFS/spermidine synthase [Acidobacteriaceae bacterium]